MGNRYIYIDNTPATSNDPDKNFEAFVSSIKKAIIKKVREKNADGTLDVLKLYQKISMPDMGRHYDRNVIGEAYQKVAIVKDLVNQGVLVMKDSSWGGQEKNNDTLAGTQPGLDDMQPWGFGYNSVGGPDYGIIYNKDGISMTAGFCHQDLGNSWDEIHLSEVWQYRKFHFVPAKNDDETQREVLGVFKDWIIDKFAEHVMNGLLQDVVEMTAQVYLDKHLES